MVPGKTPKNLVKGFLLLRGGATLIIDEILNKPELYFSISIKYGFF